MHAAWAGTDGVRTRTTKTGDSRALDKNVYGALGCVGHTTAYSELGYRNPRIHLEVRNCVD